MTDFRALCVELADAYLRTLEHINNSTWLGYEPSDDLLLHRARTALAQPEPEGPTDEDARELADDLGMTRGFFDHECGLHISCADLQGFARAVLARWGNHRGILGSSPQPPSGEAAELVELFRYAAENDPTFAFTSADMRRAADLLEQLSPPQPVRATDRLPALEDCDAEGRCWFHSVGRTWKDWYLLRASCATETETHWLPASTLPLPSGEAGE